MLQNLTGIRGIAAVWVLVYHFQAYVRDVFGELKWISPIVDNGPFGVDLFFCLSGFILAHVYFERFLNNPKDKKGELQSFFLKRFARLYPVYLATTLVALLTFVVARLVGHTFENVSGDILTFTNVLKNLAAIQILDSSPSFNYPSWSVSAELLAYLFFPFFVYGIFVKFEGTRWAAAVLFVLSLSIYEFQLFLDIFNNDGAVRVLTQFAMGLSCYLIIKGLNFPRTYASLSRFVASSLFVISMYVIQSDFVLKSLLPLFLVGIIAVNYFHSIPNRGLGRIVFMKLGLWSYSLYLTHGLIHYFLGAFDLPIRTDRLIVNIAQLLAIFFATLLIAKWTTDFVENPCRRYLIRRFG